MTVQYILTVWLVLHVCFGLIGLHEGVSEGNLLVIVLTLVYIACPVYLLTLVWETAPI